MKRSKATDWLIHYMGEQNISITQTASDLKIAESRFQGKEDFSIEEFLDLCQYLNITPEKVREEIKKEHVKI